MTDNLKETLSAFIDGEASEIEVHRLLRDHDASARSWIHFHQIRTIVRGEPALSSDMHETLRERIRIAVDDEAVFDEAPALPRRGAVMTYARPAAAFGLAASLFAAVIVGYNLNQEIDGSADPAAIADRSAPIAAQPAGSGTPINVQTVGNGLAGPTLASQDEELELRELDEDTLRAVRAYLNQHDRTARMQPVLYPQDEK